MKKLAKTFSVLTAVFLIALLFTGCAPDGPTTPPSTANPPDSGTTPPATLPAEIGTLTMATNAAFPPYEFYEGDKIVGIDAEIAGKIAEKLGLTLVIEDMEFITIIGAVQTGKVDMGMAGLTVNEERLDSVNFTSPYTTSYQMIIVPENSDIQSAADLAGKKIGVQEGTTGHILIMDEFGVDAVDGYSKGADAILALSQGKVDAVVIDREPARIFVEQNDGLVMLESEYVIEDYAIAVSKDKPEMLEKINNALEELIADGTVQSIIDKYIKAD